MTGYVFALALALVTLLFVIQLLRRKRLREKYAGIWLVVSIAIIVVGAFPGLAVRVADLVGVETPSNLLFAASSVVLLLVVIQLSTEVSGLEEETRTLAEHAALVALDLETLAHKVEELAGRPAARGIDALEDVDDPTSTRSVDRRSVERSPQGDGRVHPQG